MIHGESVARRLDPLSDPMPPLTVLYDGRCDFCRWVAANLRRWDRRRNLRLRPYQETREQPGLAALVVGRSLGRSLHVVDSAGRVASGGDSIVAIVALLPGGRAVALFVHALPLSGLVLGVTYRFLERMRPFLAKVGLDGGLIRETNEAWGGPDA